MSALVIIVMFGGISFFIFLLFLFILKREKINEQKFAAFEMSLEELNKEIYLIKKRIKNIPNVENIEEAIKNLVENVQMTEEKNIEIINLIQERINDLYSKMKYKNMPDIRGDISKSEEEKILNLYKRGYSIEEISRELRIPAGEIELIVKFSNL